MQLNLKLASVYPIFFQFSVSYGAFLAMTFEASFFVVYFLTNDLK